MCSSRSSGDGDGREVRVQVSDVRSVNDGETKVGDQSTSVAGDRKHSEGNDNELGQSDPTAKDGVGDSFESEKAC